ncbi:hypothetical protein QBD00_004572 [Ochrobactrum sp. AN78]|nr:hypothetical protein [Ochrobactrum sp. AN78]
MLGFKSEAAAPYHALCYRTHSHDANAAIGLRFSETPVRRAFIRTTRRTIAGRGKPCSVPNPIFATEIENLLVVCGLSAILKRSLVGYSSILYRISIHSTFLRDKNFSSAIDPPYGANFSRLLKALSRDVMMLRALQRLPMEDAYRSRTGCCGSGVMGDAWQRSAVMGPASAGCRGPLESRVWSMDFQRQAIGIARKPVPEGQCQGAKTFPAAICLWNLSADTRQNKTQRPLPSASGEVELKG